LGQAKSYKTVGGVAGFVLGLGIPAGCLFFRFLIASEHSWFSLTQEINQNSFFYGFMLTTIPMVFWTFGRYLGFLSDDITEQKISLEKLNRVLEFRKASLESMNELLRSQAVMDHTTGLYNRRFLSLEIEKEIQRAKRYKLDNEPMLYAMMIDIDDFKKINEHCGHAGGDYILREVAEILKRSIRKLDIVGRYGGDEFLIILPEANLETAELVAIRIQQSVRNYIFEYNGEVVSVTLSIGLAPFKGDDGTPVSTFVEEADWRLLTAKRQGKDQIITEP
jgi:diguanylate cyclase (GGDEF)-like protein